MIYKFEELKRLFKEIEMSLESPVSLFVIGGAALLHYGLGKGYTKDIDVIVMQNEHFESFRNALTSLKFQSRKKPITHFQLETYEIMECKEFRFDIFLNTVCGDFAITDSMVKRSSLVFESEKLSIYVCSKEDIFLFKSLTDRPNDLEDSIDLIKRGVDWKIIYEELVLQTKICKEKEKKKRLVWYFIERIENLKAKGTSMPIEDKAIKLYNNL